MGAVVMSVGRHQGPIIDVAVRVLEEGDGHREGPQVCRVDDDDRPEKIVPGAQEQDHGHGGDRRLDERRDDREHNAHLAGSVDPGCLDDVHWDLLDPLAEHEDPEGAGKVGRQDAEERVHPANLGELDVQGHRGDLDRHHQGPQDEQEEDVLQGEAIHGERVSSEQAKEERAAHRSDRDDEAIPVVGQPGRLGEGHDEMFQGQGGWNPLGRKGEDVGRGHQGGDDHPVERQDHERRHRADHEVQAQPSHWHQDGAEHRPIPLNTRPRTVYCSSTAGL